MGKIASLVNEGYIQMIQRKDLDILHPLLADWKLIAEYWQQNWLSSMARNELEYLRQEKLSNAWISDPLCNSHGYIDLVKLSTQTLPCCGQQFGVDKKCQMGCPEQESILHILQKCLGAHYHQIRMHKDALDLLVKI